MKILNLKSAKTVVCGLLLVSTFSASADQVILDDVIVGGSLCAGFDCVNGESFGFDTLRLKENNLRIKFQDTSSSSSFPSNDWQITINDSANGGMNHFSIDDVDSGKTPFTLEAGAPSSSLYIDSTGYLGLGTSTPIVDVHLRAANTPTLRLEQDTSGGWTSQTWDIGANESNFFVRDITSDTLPFRIVPTAPNNSFYVSAQGAIGLGTETPAGRLEIQNNAADTSLFMVNDAGQIGLGVATVDAGNLLQASNGAHLTSGGVWTNASSRSLKNNITDIGVAVALSALKALNPVTFSYKSQPAETYAGFIAEDVPEVVATNDRKSLAPMDIVAVLTKVVQQQQKAIADLQGRLDQLESK